jgi:hypothetical protein
MLVTLVHTPACHLCDDAAAALAQLAQEFPLQVELVDALAPAGRRLVGDYRAAMFPLVLLDGKFFSCGRLPRMKLRRQLERQAAGT